MKEIEFKNWLKGRYPESPSTVNNRMSNIRRVELYYGDLDKHYERDKCRELIDLMTYSMADHRICADPKHDIQIDGNIRTGTATLKKSIVLYCKFREFLKQKKMNTTGI